MNKHRVSGNHWLFFILQPYTAFMLRLYYRQFKVKGFEKIPKNKPVILAPNHQNAFMDAIVFLPSFGARRQLSYLVRASIFGTKAGDAFLYRINMLPVYRQIDGVENLGKNDAIFENCIYLMENKRVLTLFPEGTHHIKKQMLPLKKGVTRIALAAEERNNFNLGIVIFPAGIYYTRLSDFGGNVFITFGEPIHLSAYTEQYKENPNKVHNLIKSRLEKELSSLMIDIRNTHYYDCIELCREIAGNEEGINKVEADFILSKKIISKIEKFAESDPDKAVILKSASERYSEKLKTLNLRDKLFSASYKSTGIFEIVLFILIMPIGLYGWLNNYIAFTLPYLIAEKQIKDPGFKSSIKSAASMFMFPILYLIQSIIVCIFVTEWWMAMIYFVSLPLTFYPGLWWRRKLKRFSAEMRFRKNQNNSVLKEAIELRKEIITILNSL